MRRSCNGFFGYQILHRVVTCVAWRGGKGRGRGKREKLIEVSSARRNNDDDDKGLWVSGGVDIE